MRSSASMSGTLLPLALVLASGVAACRDSVGVGANPRVSMQDQCDSASFNAALGPGTCTKRGSVTLTQFNAELNASHQVAAWKFVPATFTERVGQSITASNDGGEMHTFTEVAQFGGGIVPALNQASGNTTVAPECQQLASDDRVPPRGTYTTDAATEVGTERYQCCIHPWMRAVVTVTP